MNSEPLDTNKDIQVAEVIISNLKTRGKGVEGDPIRRVLQVFTPAGDFIAENDGWLNEYTQSEMFDFAGHVKTRGCGSLEADFQIWRSEQQNKHK